MAASQSWSPARDAEIIGRPEIQRRLLDEASVVLPPTTSWAVGQDIALFCSPWRLPLERIEVSVDLWHGDADTTVPVDRAHHLARLLPSARLHELPGEGHLLVEDRMGQVLAAVTGAEQA
jgi:pimeloyl-ACP methyl ester carboxylesterase